MRKSTFLLACSLGLLTSCSTVYRPPATCTSDDDCREGEVCLVDLGGTCHDASQVPDDLPLGLVFCDSQESSSVACSFRTELRIDDQTVRPVSPSTFQVYRSEISDYVRLVFRDVAPPPAYRVATFELSQPSRWNLEPLRVVGEIDTIPENVVPVAFPFFDPRDVEEELVQSRRSIIAWLTPDSEVLGPEYFYLMRQTTNSGDPCADDEDCGTAQYCVEEAGECSPLATTPMNPETYWLQGNSENHHFVQGSTYEVTSTNESRRLGDVEMTLRYPTGAREPTVSVFDDKEELPCEDDSQCFADVARCDETSKRCVYRLGGRRASSTFFSAPEGGFSDEYVNLYGGQVPPPTQTFHWTAQDRDRERPDLDRVGPQMTFLLEGDLRAQQLLSVCMPEWAPAENIEIEVRGVPQTLLSFGGSRWICCDTSCLPTDAASVPVEDSGPCVGTVGSALAPAAPTIRLDAVVEESDIQPVTASAVWEDLACLDVISTDGVVGRVSRINTSCDSRVEPCVVTASPGIPGGRRLPYTLRVEPRSGSVLQSRQIENVIPGGEPIVIDLPPRPRLVGRVLLPAAQCDEDDGESCGVAYATVIAERLRLGNEDPDEVLGPYFYSTTTSYDPETANPGSYVLPVNPGVYLVTALPDTRTGAGPADISIAMLGPDDEVVEKNLRLHEGVPVLLRLNGFSAASVAPLDLGSWASLCHPDASDDPCAEDCDQTLDLNAIDACHGSGAVGCRIRTLVPEGAPLYPNIADEVQFLARGRRDMCDE